MQQFVETIQNQLCSRVADPAFCSNPANALRGRKRCFFSKFWGKVVELCCHSHTSTLYGSTGLSDSSDNDWVIVRRPLLLDGVLTPLIFSRPRRAAEVSLRAFSTSARCSRMAANTVFSSMARPFFFFSRFNTERCSLCVIAG